MSLDDDVRAYERLLKRAGLDALPALVAAIRELPIEHRESGVVNLLLEVLLGPGALGGVHGTIRARSVNGNWIVERASVGGFDREEVHRLRSRLHPESRDDPIVAAAVASVGTGGRSVEHALVECVKALVAERRRLMDLLMQSNTFILNSLQAPRVEGAPGSPSGSGSSPTRPSASPEHPTADDGLPLFDTA